MRDVGPRKHRMWWVAAAVAAAALTGCSSTDKTDAAAADAPVIDHAGGGCLVPPGTYLSQAQLECGLGEMGVEHCSWRVTLLQSGSYVWTFSDTGAQGTFTCDGYQIVTTTGRTVSGTFDPATMLLTWDGVTYRYQSDADASSV